MTYKENADAFLKETQFHLGDLITEQPHEVTKKFSSVIQKNTADGIKLLLKVDEDITEKAKDVFSSTEYTKLKYSIKEVIKSGNSIYFSGCGSTGRLAIMLESLWRRFWNSAAEKNPSQKDLYKKRAEKSCSIMTGGDRALIKSVENFEDYIPFGRQQTIDNKVSKNDLFIAVSEGGETSSVIGTALEAADLGAKVFFLYNNPDDVLCAKVERSKNIIEDTRVTTINLTTGSMALTGSTRMQATTMELFIIGTALEAVCGDVVNSETGKPTSTYGLERENKYLELYKKYLSLLSNDKNLEILGKISDIETETYKNNGFITYISDTYLLDIFSDTTERSPTFMLPAFRRNNDTTAVNSWAFAKDPLNNTEDAWLNLLQREPRGLTWDSKDYKNMNSPADITNNPPKLDLEEIYSYKVGNERDSSRYKNGRLLFFDLFDSRSKKNRETMLEYYNKEKGNYDLEPLHITLDSKDNSTNINLGLEETEMFLFWHLMFKLVLNSVSTGTMGVMGRIKGNWMIQVDATNKKLIDRSCRIISSLTGVTYKEACYTLYKIMEEKDKESRTDNQSYVQLTIAEIENRD